MLHFIVTADKSASGGQVASHKSAFSAVKISLPGTKEKGPVC
jgi:hypothetical protein